MGYKINRQDLFKTDNNLISFDMDNSDSIMVELPPLDDNYGELKDFIYKLDIDKEEKANILNKINALNNTNISLKEKKQIKEEIEIFKKKYL